MTALRMLASVAGFALFVLGLVAWTLILMVVTGG